MKRRILKLFMFLLLGAAVNVAVAWGSFAVARTEYLPTLWSTGPAEFTNDEDAQLWEQHALIDWPRNFGRVNRHTLLADIRSIRSSSSGMVASRITDPSTIKSLMRGWGDFRVEIIRSGFPNRSFVWHYWQGAPQHKGYASTAGHDGLQIAGWTLPLRPIWPGFAINTLFYAAILRGGWLLFAAPFAVRRRRRIKRGLCPACAYPIGTSEVCTECGKPVKA